MFETRKGSIKKILKEIDRSFPDSLMAANQKRMFLNSIEDMAVATGDEALKKIWEECRTQIDNEVAEAEGRVR